MSDPATHQLRKDLTQLLEQAGELALGIDRAVERKDDGSPVTEADKAVEALLTTELQRRFPGTGVTGEEGASCTGTEGTWFIDPIDGTASFAQRLPVWGPTICLVREGRVELGAFHMPVTKDTWFARRGHGAYLNGVRLRPDDPPNLGRSYGYVPSRIHMLPGALPWPGKVRALGSTAAHLALVASDSGVMAVIPFWSLWDVGCGALLIEEAGRAILGLEGQPVDLVNGPQGLPFLAGAPNALSHLIERWPK